MADSTEAMLPLPLDGLHRHLGGRMVAFAGYAMPIQFEGIIAEHQWTRAQAGLFDVSHMGQLLVPLAEDKALEALLPGDITGLAMGALRYSLLLAADGGILDDLMVTRRAGDLYLVVNGAVKAADIAHLRAGGISVDYREDWALLALQGPEAVRALERLVPGVSDLRFMRAAGFAWNGHDLWISRSGYTGEDGFEISVPDSAVEALAEALLAQPEVKPIGLGARDSLRLEAGLPLYGHDLDPGTNPIEAGLAFAISKRRKLEGGFPGAAQILDQLHNGAARRRVGLAVDTENEFTVFGGETVVNIPGDGHSRAIALEYRRGLWRFLELTAGAIYEGQSSLIDRYGLTTQLWLAKPFLDDRIALGVGIGPYFALDRRLKTQQGRMPIMFSSTGSYRINENWLIRATWDRVITTYDRDTDIFLGGIGYRF